MLGQKKVRETCARVWGLISTRAWQIVALIIVAILMFWLGRSTVSIMDSIASPPPPSVQPVAGSSGSATRLYAHNLELTQGTHFHAYVRWIRGLMLRTQRDREPSFDAPDSFVLEIQKGIIHVKLDDITAFLNSADIPLKKISLKAENGQFHLHGTIHKIVPLSVELIGTLSPLPDGRLQFHLKKINVLKLPLKGFLGIFHIKLDDLAGSVKAPGVQIADNDIFFDTQQLLPPPHIHGKITRLIIADSELKLVYGDAKDDDEQLAQWHNFLRLVGGTVSFGKLTMRNTDLTMIDAVEEPWFKLDLTNYQTQLVYGTTRVTSKAGLEIYMPDIDSLSVKKASPGVTLEWLKNRNTTPPSDAIK